MTHETNTKREDFLERLNQRVEIIHSDTKLMKQKSAQAKRNSSLFKRPSISR